MNKKVKGFLQFLLFFTIGATILYLLFNSLNASYIEDCTLKGIPLEQCSLFDKLIADFRSAHIFWLVIVVLLFMVSNISRAFRWQQLLKPLNYSVSFGNSFFSIMLGYFANLGLPRMGEFVRAGALARNEKIPFEKVMGTIVVGRALDFVMLAILIALGFIFNFNAIWKYFAESPLVNSALEYWWALALIGLLGIFGLIKILSWLKSDKDAPDWIKKIKEIAMGFLLGIASIKNVENKPVFIFHTIFIWLMYFMMTYFCFFAFDPTAHLSPIAGLVVFDLGAIGMVMPSPGGMGTYHYMLMQGLQLFGIDEISGFSFANILFFTIQIFCNISFGLLALILLPYLKKD